MQKTLPKGWRMVRLEDVVSEEKFAIVDGPFGTQLHISDFVTEGVPVVGIENVSTNEFVNKNLNYITADKYKELKRSTIRPNDLLITKTGTIGRTCIVPDFIKIGIITSRLAKITLNQSKCFHKYLSYFINYDNQTINNLKTSCTGSTMPILNLTSLGNLQITLPPLPTQHKIVEILEEADNLRKLRQQADEKMKDLIPSLFIKMFGDPATNPKGWAVNNIDGIKSPEKFSIVDGPFGSAMKVSDYVEDGIPVIQVSNITPDGFNNRSFRYISEEKYQSIKRSTVKSGDILIAKVGHTIGKACTMPNLFEKAVITANCAKIKVNESLTSNIYINHFINTPSFQKQIRKELGNTAKPMMNLTSIKNFQIFLPPLPLQQEFAKLVEDIEAEKARQTESKKKLDELFQSLMHRAFTGELVA